MNIDISTIGLILIISSIFQAIFIFFEYSRNRNYPGIRVFGIGSCLYAIGFLFIMIQNFGSFTLITIVFGNALPLLAIIFQYMGLIRFLNIKVKKWLSLSVFTLCLLLMAYFTFINDSINYRIIVIYFSIGLMCLLIGFDLLKNKMIHLIFSTRYLVALFLSVGAITILLTYLSFIAEPPNNALYPTFLQAFSFTGIFIMIFMLTFTFVFMINQRENTELRESKERCEQIFNLSPDASLITTLPDGTIVDFNLGFLQFTGLTREEVANKSLIELNIYEKLTDRQKLIKVFTDNKSVKGFEMNLCSKNNDIHFCSISAEYINLNNKPHIFSIIHDITNQKNAQNEILYLSYHDQLTGLYNRRFYEEEFKRLDIKENLPIALVMADINGLKLINDAYGHQMGDTLLKMFADILKSECRNDEFIFRTGGDEFVILLPKTNAKNAERLIKRLYTSISNAKINHIILSVSMGLSIKHDISEDMNAVFKQAEDAMYRYKLDISPWVKKETIELIVESLNAKSIEDIFHAKEVSDFSERIAREMGFGSETVSQIKMVGLRHDIGEIAISDKILNKLEELTADDWTEIKRHPEIGYQILRSVNELAEVAKYVLEHHEHWDGSGYPKGLKGEEISVQGRIVAIADAYSAMTSDRPFRKALTPAEAIAEIKRCSVTQFDANIARIFIEKILMNEW